MKIWSFFSKFKADWNNHLIGFIGTILGILIALQLDSWQDSRNEAIKLATFVKSLQQELSANREQINLDISNFTSFISHTDFIINHQKTDTTVVCTSREWDSLKLINPKTFSDSRLTQRRNTSAIEFRHTFMDIPFDFVPGRINTDNWEATKSSGLLTSFPQVRLTTFTRVYGGLSRKFTETSPDDFLIYARDSENLDIKVINQIAKSIRRDLKLKLRFIDESYDVIMTY